MAAAPVEVISKPNPYIWPVPKPDAIVPLLATVSKSNVIPSSTLHADATAFVFATDLENTVAVAAKYAQNTFVKRTNAKFELSTDTKAFVTVCYSSLTLSSSSLCRKYKSTNISSVVG